MADIIECAESPAYFILNHCQIYDAEAREWIPFDLWVEQGEALDTIEGNRLTVILKARQLGMTWLVLCYALWLMLFRPMAAVLLFSRRDDEAIHLLDFRLKGIYGRLPPHLKGGLEVVVDSKHEWELTNGSTARRVMFCLN